jgi:tRNA A-37 threonylcarbamoyl transferase component Bud32
MTHYFVAANLWFIAGLVLLVGGQNVFGYVRLNPAIYWGAVWAAFGIAAVCARRWKAGESPRSGGSPPAARDVAVVSMVGLVLFVGMCGSVLLWLVSRGHLSSVLYIAYAVLVVGCLGVGAALLFVWLIRIVQGPKVTHPKPQVPVVAAHPGDSPKPTASSSRPTTNPAPPRNRLFGPILVGTLAGLWVLGFGLPAWLDGRPNAPAWVTEYAAPVGTVGLWVVLLIALIGLLGAFRRLKSPMPDPNPGSWPTAMSATPVHQNCPRCGQPIPAGSPQGLCPRCLLQGVMPSADRPSPTLAFVEAYVAPTVEEVAKLFPLLEVKELIGQGGMGAVYLARQMALDRFVALKLVRPRETDPTFAERFVREAKAMARLSHPNVVAVYESGEAGGLPYLVMEYVDGVTLRDAMRERKLTPAEALAIVPQICDALGYAHAQGIVHRDVKPENILLGRDGRLKIADFGLAKVTDPAGVSLTGTRQAMGTPHYMAPEQWEKPGDVDHRADIYALGVVLYELLTGELPIGRFDPPSQKIQLDIRLDEVVLRALAKEPDRRYQHASDVKTALDAIRSGSGGWVRTPTSREYRSKRTLLGWPLVHIVSGLDPLTGRPKTAKGWLAIGDGRAVGGIALAGGSAFGGLAVSGGVSFGVLAGAGGFAFGGFALAGGMAFAAAVSMAGGMAIAGVLAMAGGFAGGTFASASSARGEHVLSATRQDEDFADALANWFAALWPM